MVWPTLGSRKAKEQNRTVPRKTAENTAKHSGGGVGSVVDNHRGGGESSMVVTTLVTILKHYEILLTNAQGG